MIKFKTLSWSNAFSYGANNSINFADSTLIQLLGKNGNGKSSIALILEEVLFNTNSKKIKKADVINRYTDASNYTIALDFSKDNDDYGIITTRGTTQTVKLYKNKQDISAHTSTNTYKLIEEIIGLDHKSFSQIVYQSNAFSLEFLTATDTNRKKFLIDLLNLSIYTQYADTYKALVKELSSDIDIVNTKIKTISNWLDKFGSESLSKKALKEVPEAPTEEIRLATELKDQLANIEANNKKISQNNKYKEILSAINIDSVPCPSSNLLSIKVDIRNLENSIAACREITRGKLLDNCTTCGQAIDNSNKKLQIEEANNKLMVLKRSLVGAESELDEATAAWDKYEKAKTAQQEWEKYHNLINTTLATTLYDREEIGNNLLRIEKAISDRNTEIASANKYNNDVISHNTKIDVIIQQMDTMRVDFAKYSEELSKLTKRMGLLQILVKTFGTSGLVAYKIECLVKDLEALTNEYLTNMSDGRFQLSFIMNSSDKLNVVITDNGHDIDILALSNGERARVNVSTLLAIRKLLQSLSSSRINLLILDETIESLDAEGKERLVDILLNEEYLNTVLISHGFSHPLLTKINIIKENNISRIE